MNWELLLQASGIVVGAIISLYQISHLLPGSRSTLKADLEILKLLEPTDPNHHIVKAHVDSTIRSIYPASTRLGGKAGKKFEWKLFLFFVGYTIGLAALTLWLIRTNHNGWAVVTGIFTLIGMLVVAGHFVDDEEKKKAE